MKILFVAMSNSIHVVRWIRQISQEGWDIHLFPSIDLGIVHPELTDVTVYHSFYGDGDGPRNPAVRLKGWRVPGERYGVPQLVRRLRQARSPYYRTFQLRDLIERIQPDIVHSLEFQHAAYMTVEVRKILGDRFPPWIVTNWGSDIYLFGRLKAHIATIREILSLCDYYTCECERDVQLANELGLKGEAWPVLPNTGGLDLEHMAQVRQERPSARRVIMIKGYQGTMGRSLVALNALRLCADVLRDYHVIVYSVHTEEVWVSVELISTEIGIPIEIQPQTSHSEMLRLFGLARVYVGLSISDAASTSMLEALAAGVFPIQSYTACADEWLTDGETGLLVEPENPQIVADAIRRAVTDDDLVDLAAEKNWITANARLDQKQIAAKVIELYKEVYAKGRRVPLS